jgi:phasin family protein
MNTELNEFLEQQKHGLLQLASDLRKARIAAARKAARESAARIKSLNVRVRTLARSGVRLSVVSHGAVQNLIELQGDIVSSALNEAAEKIQQMAYTESVRDLARLQTDVLQAARQRIVEDIARAVVILKEAAGDARKVATRATAAEAPAAKPTARRKVKQAARKSARSKTKTAARKKRIARKVARR